MVLPQLAIERFFGTARERYAIRLRRQSAEPSPWTTDQVFRQWRFTNVHREHDRTTEWFREHVRQHLTGLPVVEAAVIFRWFNRIDTGERVRDLLLNGWDTAEARRRLAGVQPLVSGAYRIGSPPGMSKLEGLLCAIDAARPLLPSRIKEWGRSLQVACNSVAEIPYIGPFLAYEIVSDLRHTPVLGEAEDVMTWAQVGPGATQGLGWIVAGRPDRFRYGSTHDQAFMLAAMRELLPISRDPQHWPQDWAEWEMREVEHWSCELAKYNRALRGESLKRRFADGAGRLS